MEKGSKPCPDEISKGVTVTVASLILMTAIKSAIKLPVNYVSYAVVLSTALLLISKIPAPLIVLVAWYFRIYNIDYKKLLGSFFLTNI